MELAWRAIDQLGEVTGRNPSPIVVISLFLAKGKATMKYTETVPFLYGATAHFPPDKRKKSDIVFIYLVEHPILHSRAVSRLQPGDKSSENEVYLSSCKRACEERCPVRVRSAVQTNIICDRSTLLRAIARTEDCSELDAQSWSQRLSVGLCRPKVY